MRKNKPPVEVKRGEKRTGDVLIREWTKRVGSVMAAERLVGMYPRHLHNWLNDPDRRFTPEVAQNLSRVSGVPIEAILYRWTPIKELDMWKWA